MNVNVQRTHSGPEADGACNGHYTVQGPTVQCPVRASTMSIRPGCLAVHISAWFSRRLSEPCPRQQPTQVHSSGAAVHAALVATRMTVTIIHSHCGAWFFGNSSSSARGTTPSAACLAALPCYSRRYSRCCYCRNFFCCGCRGCCGYAAAAATAVVAAATLSTSAPDSSLLRCRYRTRTPAALHCAALLRCSQGAA